jgi:hypothetical protein
MAERNRRMRVDGMDMEAGNWKGMRRRCAAEEERAWPNRITSEVARLFNSSFLVHCNGNEYRFETCKQLFQLLSPAANKPHLLHLVVDHLRQRFGDVVEVCVRQCSSQSSARNFS